MLFILFFFLLTIFNGSNAQNTSTTPTDIIFDTKHVVRELTFLLSGNSLLWPCESTKNIYVKSGRYIPRNVIVTRAQLQRHKAYVVLPRYKHGVPFTLGQIHLKVGHCRAKIAPYPCWAIQEEGNCEALQSVVDIVLDHYGLLWILDVGIVNTLEQPVRRCKPKIIAINTANGKVVKRIDLGDLLTDQSRLQFLLIDYGTDNKPFAYVADAGARSILVYDIFNSRSYRVVLPSQSATSAVNDVLYMALTNAANSSTTLYFTYLNSPHLYKMNCAQLRSGKGNGAIVEVGTRAHGKQMVLLGGDGGTSLFFRYKGENDIYMWNTNVCFKASNIKEVQRCDDCRLSTQVLPGHKRFMWALESNFHDFINERTGCNGASIILHPVVQECDD